MANVPFAVTFFLLFSIAGSSFGAQSASSERDQTLFEKISPSVVVVSASGFKANLGKQGSGVVIAVGHVITNCHVVSGTKKITVSQGTQNYSAKIFSSAPDHDLCELLVAGLTAPSVALRPSAQLRVGDPVFALGSPEGLELTFSSGNISALRQYENERLIQFTASVSPGSSGGGLFDKTGALVGITTFGFRKGQNLNFALPSEWVSKLDQSAARVEKNADAAKTDATLDYILLVQHAQDLAWEGRVQESIDLFQSASNQRPDDPEPRIALGELFLDIVPQNTDRALVNCLAAQRIVESAESWSCLGGVYQALNRASEARMAFENAIRMSPETPEYWMDLGIFGVHFKDAETARRAYFRLRALDPALAAQLWELISKMASEQ